MKIFIPKNKIKINKPKNPFIITKFESKIYSLYNNGKIPYPVHLTKGNEVQPYNAHGNNYGSCTDSLNSLTGNPLPESYSFN